MINWIHSNMAGNSKMTFQSPFGMKAQLLSSTEELARISSTSNLSTQHSEPSAAVVLEGIPKEVIDFEFVDDPDLESDDDDGDAPFSDHSTDNEED